MKRLNIRSVEKTGTFSMPANQNRGYFAVFAISGGLTIEFGEGGGLIPVAESGYYEPYTTPISEINIIGGTFIVVSTGV